MNILILVGYKGEIIYNRYKNIRDVNIEFSFGKDEDTKALQYADLAQRQGYQPLQKLKVEPSTLRALVRERLENGKEMPMDLFNVFVGNRTKITKS